MAARSKAWVCCRSIAEIEVSNPTEGIDFRFLCFVACCVGGGLCEELITRPGESWRVCLCACDLETSTVRLPGPEMGCCAKCTRHKFLWYDIGVSVKYRTDVREMGCEVGWWGWGELPRDRVS